MLVDLARNDVNRVCQPKTVKVDHLMQLEKFSHVIHITSQVSGLLRQGLNRYEYPTELFLDAKFTYQVRRVSIYFSGGYCLRCT